MLFPDQVHAARAFVLLHARLLDRHRFAYLFAGGSAEDVLAALRPYQNPDGGFGHGLEPDGRGPESQPAHVDTALRVLDEIDRCHDPLLDPALAYLTRVTAANGGLPVLIGGDATLRAPWWAATGERPVGTLLPTARIAGLLHKHRIDHPWLAGATAFCWQGIEHLDDTHPYEIEWCLDFLDHVPERARAEAAAARLGELVRARRLVTLATDDPAAAYIPPGYAPGEIHTPLDYAPRPTSLARRWFTTAEIAADLDALERGQQADGGWTFTWRAWNQAASIESRAAVTIRALTILRADGRLPQATPPGR